MKALIKRLLPQRALAAAAAVAAQIALRREFARDRRRYRAAMLPDDGFAHPGLRGRNLEAQVTKDYHRVEKGLALRDPKQPFGDAVGRRLDALVPVASRVAPEAPYVAHAISARAALHDWNSSGSRAEDISPLRDEGHRGVVDADQFFATRHSVRDFDTADVPDSVLEHAVSLATHTPSVCNRQAWHVRFFRGPDVRRILGFQNGNAGFADSIPVVALVSTDGRMFAGSGERNQPWIEGGLFSMSLVWALHGLGVDSCMLNLSVTNDRADALRVELGLDASEFLIMMVAIGYGRKGHRRARSPRRALSDVLK